MKSPSHLHLIGQNEIAQSIPFRTRAFAAQVLLLAFIFFIVGLRTARSYQSTLEWQNVPVTPQTGTFTVSFDFTPQQAGMDGFVGISQGAADAFNDMACSVRVFNNNRSEAYNSNGYPTGTIPYTAGTTYRVVMTINAPAKKYSATVNGQPLAVDYNFRIAQNAVPELNNVVIKHQSGTYLLDQLVTGGGNENPPAADMPVYEKVVSFTGMLEGAPPRDNKGHPPAAAAECPKIRTTIRHGTGSPLCSVVFVGGLATPPAC